MIQILLYNIIAHCIWKGQLALRVRLPSSMMPHTVLLSYWPPFLSSWVQYSDCNRFGCSFREITGEIFSHLWRAHWFFLISSIEIKRGKRLHASRLQRQCVRWFLSCSSFDSHLVIINWTMSTTNFQGSALFHIKNQQWLYSQVCVESGVQLKLFFTRASMLLKLKRKRGQKLKLKKALN